MLAMRIDNFDGDDRAYAGYLLGVLTEFLPGHVHQLVHQLEERVKEARRGSNLSRVVLEIGHPTPPASLEVKIWAPPKQSSSPRQATKNRWVSQTATFFEELPKSEAEWVEKRKAARLFETEDILSAVDWLKTGQPRTNIPFTDHTQKPDLQDVLVTLGQNAGKALTSSSFSHNVSEFLSLVFIATCYVAVEEGHPEHSVDDAQVAFLKASRGNGKCNEGHRQLKEDRTTVQWLLEEMQHQFWRGLRHRAFELFLLSGKGINFYGRCPREGEQNDLFKERFPYCNVPDEKQASLPFWIPFFVKLQIGDRWSYSTICRALGVYLLHREEDFHQFSETLRSKKLVVCRLEVPRPPPDQPRKRRPGRKPAPRNAKSGGRGGQTPHVGSAPGQGGSGFQAHLVEATLRRGFQPINVSPQGCGEPTTSSQPQPTKRRRTSREFRHGNSHLAEVPAAQNASPLGFELLLVASGQVERDPCDTTLNSPAESGPLADETVALHDPPFRGPADIPTRKEGENAEQRFALENPGRTNSVVPTLRPAGQASRSGYAPVPDPNVNLLDLTSTGQAVTGVNRRYAAIGRNSPDGAGGKRLRHGHDDATASHRDPPPNESDVESLPGRFDGQDHPLDESWRRADLPASRPFHRLSPHPSFGEIESMDQPTRSGHSTIAAGGMGTSACLQGLPAGGMTTEILCLGPAAISDLDGRVGHVEPRRTTDDNGQNGTPVATRPEASSMEQIVIGELSGCDLFYPEDYFDFTAAALPPS